jgi:putative flippase GtrA
MSSHTTLRHSAQSDADEVMQQMRAMCAVSSASAIGMGILACMFFHDTSFGLDMIQVGVLGLFLVAAYNIPWKPFRYAFFGVLALAAAWVLFHTAIDMTHMLDGMRADMRARQHAA